MENYVKTYDLKDVKQMIAKTFDKKTDGDSMGRDMHIHKSNCNYGNMGCVFFALNGSPPKGYALYVPEHHYLIIIDAWGKTKRITCTSRHGMIAVTGYEDLPDNAIIKDDPKK